MQIISLNSRFQSTERCHWIQVRIHPMNRGALQVVSQEKVPCLKPGLEKRNTAGAFYCCCLLALNWYLVVILDLWKSCKATIENLHMPLTQTSPMLKFHIMMIYLSKLRTTFVYYYQLNSRLDSGFLRFFSGYSLCMLLTPHILYLIIMPPLSLPIHDCV